MYLGQLALELSHHEAPRAASASCTAADRFAHVAARVRLFEHLHESCMSLWGPQKKIANTQAPVRLEKKAAWTHAAQGQVLVEERRRRTKRGGVGGKEEEEEVKERPRSRREKRERRGGGYLRSRARSRQELRSSTRH